MEDKIFGYSWADIQAMQRGKYQRKRIPAQIAGTDYGADPIGNGLFKMIPSGDIVSFDERCKRLS